MRQGGITSAVQALTSYSLSNEQKHFVVTVTCAAAICLILLVFLATVTLITGKGLSHFWPQPVYQVQYLEQGRTEKVYAVVNRLSLRNSGKRLLLLQQSTYHAAGTETPIPLSPERVISLEPDPKLIHLALNDGTFALGLPSELVVAEQVVPIHQLAAVLEEVQALQAQIDVLMLGDLAIAHRRLSNMQKMRVAEDAPAYKRYEQIYQGLQTQITRLQRQIDVYQLQMVSRQGAELAVPLVEVSHWYFPNDLSLLGKTGVFLTRVWHFVADAPKQANTAGGVFPALFGTVLMVLLMTVLVTPFGVLAAVYLTEYAPNNTVVSILRIAVNNLAGVPSIVYGVVGLGFFVYTLGGKLDQLLYGDVGQASVFGTPGLMWASLTMALLTLPVVIVATEEGLRRVPHALRAGSYALGATKSETIWRTVLPLASPGIMTGVILAIARGAGEVAPLLLLGAVKFAPILPIDAEFPFLHLDRQFMHLGVLIYDGAFHGEYTQQGSDMMYSACLLLLLVVLVLNLLALSVRNRLRRRYSSLLL